MTNQKPNTKKRNKEFGAWLKNILSVRGKIRKTTNKMTHISIQDAFVAIVLRKDSIYIKHFKYFIVSFPVIKMPTAIIYSFNVCYLNFP